MQPLKVLASGVGVFALMIVGLIGGLYWNVSNPGRGGQLELPERSTNLGSPKGSAWIGSAHVADYVALSNAFETQQKGSWCGVASAVTVLNALGTGDAITQEGFFTPEIEAIRSFLEVTFGGMSLDDFGDLLRAHGATVELTHAAASSEDEFRKLLSHNTAKTGDFFVVNYDRNALDEWGGGHISPIAAYAPDVDQALIFDTASYKYPAHWVPVADLFAAMNTTDGSSGKTRGWAQVSPGEVSSEEVPSSDGPSDAGSSDMEASDAGAPTTVSDEAVSDETVSDETVSDETVPDEQGPAAP